MYTRHWVELSCVVINGASNLRPYFSRHPGIHLDADWNKAYALAALGHTLMPFCSVCRQFFGFIPSSVHVLQISSDDVRPVFPWPSRLSLVARLSSHCMASRGILESSILNTCPSHFSLLFVMMSCNVCSPVFFLMCSFLTLSFHVIPNSLRWNLWWAAFSVFICVAGSGHNSAPYSSVEATHTTWLSLVDLCCCFFPDVCWSSKDTRCFSDSHRTLFVAVS